MPKKVSHTRFEHRNRVVLRLDRGVERQPKARYFWISTVPGGFQGVCKATKCPETDLGAAAVVVGAVSRHSPQHISITLGIS